MAKSFWVTSKVRRTPLETGIRLTIISLMLALCLAWTGGVTPFNNAVASGAVQSFSIQDTPADLDPTLLGAALPTPLGTLLNRLEANQSLEFEIGLAQPDPAAAEAFVSSLTDPHSPNYHHYLTPDQYTARYNPTLAQQNFVISYLTGRGFQVVQTSPNRLLLQVKAPVHTIETTFHTQLSAYHYDEPDGQTFDYFAPSYQTILPASLRGLVSGVILTNFPLPRTGQPRLPQDGVQPQATSPGLSPAQLRQLYNSQPLLTSGIDGAGQTMALFELGDYDPANIAAFATYYNLPTPNISIVKVGNPKLIPIFRGGSEAEIELDIEVAMSIAPKAHIIVYEGPIVDLTGSSSRVFTAITFIQILSKIYADNQAAVVSISYGGCESGRYPAFTPDALNLMHVTLQQGIAQGIITLAASGDSGAYQCSSGQDQSDTLGVNYPASDPYVVGVGGTQFSSGGTVTSPNEKVWSNPPKADGSSRSIYGDGSGGGLSGAFTRPSWQVGPGVVNQYSNGHREVPDVAALAGEPGYGVFVEGYGKPIPIGGTSAASPLWAAATLLLNQYAGKRVFSIDRLYSLAANGSAAFRDTTSGNNLYYPATVGYDLATGLGTPDFTQLANALNGQAALPNPTATPPSQPTNPPNPNPTNTPAPNPTDTPLPTATPTNPPPTATPAPPPSYPVASNLFSWKKYAITPVFPPASNGWDSGSVYPQTVLWDSTAKTYKMWYVGSSPANLPALGYATSPDGINWTRNGPNPVVQAGPANNWDSKGVLQAAVIYDPDEKLYKLWYSSKTSYTAPSIGYAISNDGISWTKDASPVLLAGPTSFDFGGMQPSTVIKESGQYKMWYEAVDDQNQRALAYTYSLDGIHWAKPQAANVQINGAIYNADGPGAPGVVHYQNAYYLWYHTSTNIMQASSSDGQNFTLDPTTTVLDVSAAGAADSNRLIVPRVVLRTDSNQALMWYSGYNGSNWSGMLATSPLNTGTPSPTPPTVPAPTPGPPAINQNFADPAFQQVWNRPDKPIIDGAVKRGWLWGPGPQASAYEEYAEAQNGLRLVQYFDKGRLEINNLAADRNDPYFVSSGLLAKEMVSGNVQTGNNQYRYIGPSNVPVAGDTDDTNGPTYASFAKVLTAPSVQVGQPEITAIDSQGNTGDNQIFASFGVTAASYVPETKHSIASPFWNFLNSSGLVYDKNGNQTTDKLFSPIFYVTGLPLTEAYWATVKVAGTVKPVLIQVFERRVLTYTPSNDSTQQVEMGNVGRAYFQWRYGKQL